MKTVQPEPDLLVTYDDSPEVQAEVFQRLLDWFHEHQCYSGESIMQCDAPQLTAPELLSDIADIIGFDPMWDDGV